MRSRILLSVPHTSGGELANVSRAFATNWISTVGPDVDAFEEEMGQRIGVPAVALSSGTAAIHLGLRLLGVQPGDEVLCPTLTFVATCNPVRYLGAEPVFIDSETATWNLDPNVLETALKARAESGRLPRAALVVHLYGQCADMDPILEICGRYEVPVLEDAAQALGATYKGRAAGAMGAAGIFSFNGNKIITTAGGGMLVSPNQGWVEKARFWAQQARNPGRRGYEHSEIGYNYRMSNVLAAIGRAQLQLLDTRIEQRRAIAFRYREGFAGLPGVLFMPQSPNGLHTNWLSCFLIDKGKLGCSRDELIARLHAANIEARPVWKPMHLQPLYANCEHWGGAVAEELFERGICLPSSSSLRLEDQLYVINAVRKAAGAADWQWKDDGELRPGQAGGHDPVVSIESNGAEQELSHKDMMGRTGASADDEPVRNSICGRVVLVTGAAGSIGSELCRQIARFDPAAIVGFDIAESPLFELELQMQEAFPAIAFRAEIGSIQNPARLDEVMNCYKPAAVYHAAAYKHVPLMESHPLEAIENNVFGTYNVGLAALAHGVENFVLISSDKAVRPTSVMGVSKRIAELVLLGMQDSATKFVAVRFGNVIDSSGSVVPIFRRQIAQGGPVTVTDPEMERFFMTGPEAGHLVLQAAAIGGPGQICVLDMGSPVRIVDLAASMIQEAGYRPGQDIAIEFTGRRPGEKLSEELASYLENTVCTRYESIRILERPATDQQKLDSRLVILRSLCNRRDIEELVQVMKDLVPDYFPSDELLRQVVRQSA
jgi:pyridoxal phosphate-dependent aminotransferase EpsN